MQLNRRIQLYVAALALLSSFIIHPSSLLGQGSLTPPGAPGASGTMMKTLNQIEARTAITNASSIYIITQPGSYYLTTNLTVSSGDAIDINTNDVTLDLNGFTISSTAAVGSPSAGIAIGLGVKSVTIVNGHINGGVTNNGSGVYSGLGFYFGIFADGIDSPTGSPTNVVVSKVSVAGVFNIGIGIANIDFANGNATVVEDCTVTTVGGRGICASVIKGSAAIDCGITAIYGDQVVDCRGVTTGNGYGVSATATAQNCYGQSSSGIGLRALVAVGCVGYSTSGVGIQATIANSCWISHGTTNITFPYNMPH